MTSAIKDSGYKSRKFTLTIIGLVLLTLIALSVIKWPAIVAIFPTYVGGIIGVLGLYLGGNIAQKYVVNKSGVTINNTPTGEQ